MRHALVSLALRDGTEFDVHFDSNGKPCIYYRFKMDSFTGLFRVKVRNAKVDQLVINDVIRLIKSLAEWVKPYLPEGEELIIDHKIEVPVSGFRTK